jgi:hypothetical protein
MTRQPIQLPKALAASFTLMLKDNRKAKLDALVTGGHILPVVRDDLAKEYCSDQSLALSLDALSLDTASENIAKDAAFDSLVEALKKNKAVQYGEKTGAQLPNAVALANPSMDGDTESDNLLTRDADARRKAFAGV